MDPVAIIQGTFVAAAIATVLTGSAILVGLLRIASGGGLAHLDRLDGHNLPARAADVSARLRTRYLARASARETAWARAVRAQPFEPTADDLALWHAASASAEPDPGTATRAA